MLLMSPLRAIDDGKCDIVGVTPAAPTICGVAAQGGMLYGEVRGWDVYAGDVKISNRGVFVIGLDRDAADTLKLKFCKQSGGACQTYSYPIKQRKYIEQHVKVAERFDEDKQSPELKKRIVAEAARVQSVRAAALDDTTLYFMNMRMPDDLKKYKMGSLFGSRRVFNNVPKSPHKGVDFSMPAGAPLYPIADGVVIMAEGEHFYNGNIVMVSHGHGIVSAYLHMSKIDVHVGDMVNDKTILGRVGSTGRSSGAHLHLGLYHGQTAIDPALFIVKGGAQNVRN